MSNQSDRVPSKKATLARRLGAVAVVSLAALAMNAGVSAQETSGMRVVKDPVTGLLRAPTNEELKAQLQQEARARGARAASAGQVGIISRTAPSLVRRADGSRKLELTEDSMTYSVMSRNPDGSLNMNCVTGEDAAERALKARNFAAGRVAKGGSDEQQ